MHLFIASNANHVRMFGPTMAALDQRGVASRLISCDRWYEQGATAVATAMGVSFDEIEFPNVRGSDWFSTPWNQRLAFTEAGSPLVNILLDRLNPTGITLGNDTGLLEQTFIVQARRRGIPTSVLQDADLSANSLPLFPAGQLRPGEGGCDAVFSWGRRGTRYFRALGLRVPIWEVGSPKTPEVGTPGDPLVARELGIDGQDGRRRILVALQCCARYGNLTVEEERALYAELIETLRASGDFEILVTPHPSHTPAERDHYSRWCMKQLRSIWMDGWSSQELLPFVDAVVAIDSAFLLDSLAQGVPVIAATLGIPWARTDYERAAEVVESWDSLRRLCSRDNWLDDLAARTAPFRETFVEGFLWGRGTASASQLAQSIVQFQEEWASPCADPAGVGVIVRVTDETTQDVPSVLAEIARQRGVRTRVLVIDATEQGIASTTPALKSGSVLIRRDQDPAWGRCLSNAVESLRTPFITLWEPGVSALPHRLARQCALLQEDPKAAAATCTTLCALESGPALVRQGTLPAGERGPYWRSTVLFRREELVHMGLVAFWPSDRERLDRLAELGRVVSSDEAMVIVSDADHRRKGPAARLEDHLVAREPARGSLELSVIICTFNRPHVALACIESFCRQDTGSDRYELIVVDDSTDNTLDRLLEDIAWPVPHCVLRRPRGSLASARNAAVAVARGRILLFVNDDTIASPQLIAEHLRAHRVARRPVSILGTFQQPEKALQNALMRHLEHSTEVFAYEKLKSGQNYDWTRYWTCNISSPAESVRAVGGFDEEFAQYGCEDTDLGIRLHHLGLPVIYWASARAEHRHVLSLDDLNKRQIAVSTAWAHLIRKHPTVLDHPDWSWVQTVTRESCRQFIAGVHPHAETWMQVASDLSRWNVQAMERLGTAGAKTGKTGLALLGELVTRLNRLWWQKGFLVGLDAMGLDGFAPLLRELPPVLAAVSEPRILVLPDPREPATSTPGLVLGCRRAHNAHGTLVVVARSEDRPVLADHLAAATLAAGLPECPPVLGMEPPPSESGLSRLFRGADLWVPSGTHSDPTYRRLAFQENTGTIEVESGHPLGMSFPLRLLVRPDWNDPSAIAHILDSWGRVLAGREDVGLVLLLDPEQGPSHTQALAQTVTAHEETLGAETALTVLLLDDADCLYDQVASVRSVHAVLGSDSLADLADVPICHTIADLRALLATYDARRLHLARALGVAATQSAGPPSDRESSMAGRDSARTMGSWPVPSH